MNSEKVALAPTLRFPEFRNAGTWKIGKIDELVDTVTLPKKLPTSQYSSEGKFPIIDQSQAVICGWTDDQEALIQAPLPLIIFGDHTCILKLLNRPFAQGADGIKILKSRPRIVTEYLYQFLIYQPVVTEEYKRHYSILKEKLVYFPDAKTGEQQKIADCLTSADELIGAQAQKVEALKAHKKGLMQQLFPRPERTENGQKIPPETKPRLRFPEFAGGGDWKVCSIGDLKPFVTSGSRGWSAYYADQGELFVRITNLQRNSIYLDLRDSKFVDLPSGVNEGVRTQLKAGDVLISITADIGSIGYVDEHVSIPAYINQHIALVRFNAKEIASKFVAYFLSSDLAQQSFRTSTDNGTKAGMSLISVNRIGMTMPKLAEQQRISDYLTSLDELIAAQSQKLDTLKTHKKALMQQLFPAPKVGSEVVQA